MTLVAFDELDGSPTFDVKSGSYTATRIGLITWSDGTTFISQNLPVTIYAGSQNIQVAGTKFPGIGQLYIESVDIEPFGNRITNTDTTQDFTQVNTYEKGKVTVKYATLTYQTSSSDQNAQQLNNDPVPFLEHRWSAGGEFLTVEKQVFVYSLNTSLNVTQEVQPGIFIPTTEHQISWARVLNPPFDAIRLCRGTVNDAPFTLTTGTAAIETLLFLGADLEREVMTDGTRAWKVTYRFSEKSTLAQDGNGPGLTGAPATITTKNTSGTSKTWTVPAKGGWNHFFSQPTGTTNPATPGFWRIQAKSQATGTNNGPFQISNFNLLFPTS